MRVPVGIVVLAAALARTPGLAAGLSADSARDAASVFGRSLTSGHAEALRPLLPQRGKVGLRLARLGPEDGTFGAHQVEAVFQEFLASGAVGSFESTAASSAGCSVESVTFVLSGFFLAGAAASAAITMSNATATPQRNMRAWYFILLLYVATPGPRVERHLGMSTVE